MTQPAKHYLQAELEDLFRTDHKMWLFLQQGSLDGIWYWDLEKPDNEWMSPEMWRLFGVDPETKGHDPAEWQDLIFQEDLKVALDNFEKHLADPHHPYDQIVRYRHADGSTVWVRCRGIAVRDENGKPLRMLGAHNDITAAMKAEEDARAAFRKTEAANEELRTFAYSISHDLKAPSNTMQMILRELVEINEGDFSDDQRSLISMAQNTAEHMRMLVEDLLSYTRLIDRDLPWETVPLENVVSDVKQHLAGSIAETSAILNVENLPTVPGNLVQLRILFQNLIENAIKYKHPSRDPKITVKSVESKDSAMVAVCVIDNGLGIAPEYHERIFELFKRLHRADEVQGTGLGLSLCRRVAQNHGGSIRVSSERGNGSTFTICLPRHRT